MVPFVREYPNCRFSAREVQSLHGTPYGRVFSGCDLAKKTPDDFLRGLRRLAEEELAKLGAQTGSPLACLYGILDGTWDRCFRWISTSQIQTNEL